MEIRSIPAIAQGPQGIDALGATAAPPPEQPETPSNALDPPVKVDIGSDAHQARFVRDPDTSTIVFQVVDPISDTVLAQLPSETALRNRAYAQSGSQAGAGAAGISRVA